MIVLFAVSVFIVVLMSQMVAYEFGRILNDRKWR